MSPSSKKRKVGLGRGIGALFDVDDVPRQIQGASRKDMPVVSAPRPASRYCLVDIELVVPNPHQPRKAFGQEELQELAQSIAKDGLLQPIVVMQSGKPGESKTLQVVAGERRLRAAKLAGLRQVPVHIKKMAESERLRLALIENIQRQDLNPMEEAQAYREVMRLGSLSQAQCGQMVGKDRSTVANALRLLDLPAELHDQVAAGVISSGHARALLYLSQTAPKMLEVAAKIVREGLSVRATERLCRSIKKAHDEDPGDWSSAAEELPVDVEMARIEQNLRSCFGTKVVLSGKPAQGKIEVHYYSAEELERVLELMGV